MVFITALLLVGLYVAQCLRRLPQGQRERHLASPALPAPRALYDPGVVILCQGRK